MDTDPNCANESVSPENVSLTKHLEPLKVRYKRSRHSKIFTPVAEQTVTHSLPPLLNSAESSSDLERELGNKPIQPLKKISKTTKTYRDTGMVPNGATVDAPDDDTDATGHSSTDSCDESDDDSYADTNESESMVAAPLENKSNGATFNFCGHNVLDGSTNEIIAKKDPYDY